MSKMKAAKKRAYQSPTRQRQADETRTRIAAAARKLLEEHGYAGMTMEAVAQKAGGDIDKLKRSLDRFLNEEVTRVPEPEEPEKQPEPKRERPRPRPFPLPGSAMQGPDPDPANS